MLIKDLLEASNESFITVRNIFKSIFARHGLNILFPTHSNARSVVGDRGSQVQEQHLIDILNRIIRLYKMKDDQLMKLLSAVKQTRETVQLVFIHQLEDTAVNLPCAIKVDQQTGKLTFVIKTIMIKPDFVPFPGDTVIRV